MEQVVIKGGEKKYLFSLAEIKELIHYKDLLYLLVLRDVKVIYKQSIIGFGWAVIRPLVQMIIFTVFFGKLAGIEKQIEGGIPYQLFSYAALLPWTYFSGALTASTSSLISSSNFLTKVYFPRFIIPLTPVLAKLVDLFIAFVIMIGLMMYYKVSVTVNIIMLPVLVVLMAVNALSISLWLSALAIQYRDIHQMIQFLVQLLMWLTPIIWPITYILGNESVPKIFQILYQFYPMAGIIEGFRASILGIYEIPWGMLGMGTITTVVTFLTGLIFFRRRERIFADVV